MDRKSNSKLIQDELKTINTTTMLSVAARHSGQRFLRAAIHWSVCSNKTGWSHSQHEQNDKAILPEKNRNVCRVLCYVSPN